MTDMDEFKKNVLVQVRLYCGCADECGQSVLITDVKESEPGYQSFRDEAFKILRDAHDRFKNGWSNR